MRSSKLIINTVRELYLKYGGQNHRQIEREMRDLGCNTFSRRVFYNQKTKTGIRLGWPARFGWNEALPNADTPLRSSSSPPTTGSLTNPKSEIPNPNFEAWLKKISPNMTWDWPYQKLIYDQLHRITTGESKRLMIFLPPRHGKSELVTNRFAAWCLLNDPQMNIIIGSYNQRLANRFSRKIRITLEDAYEMQNKSERVDGQESVASQHVSSGSSPRNDNDRPTSNSHASSDRQQPTADCQPMISKTPRHRLNTVAEWETGLGGGVRAVGVGGGITGFGADLVIIDDPIKSRAEAESKTYRERCHDWFNDDLYTRLEPGARMILIQTRWHEDDLAGRLLREMSDGGEHWDVISLPALALSEPPAAPVEISAGSEPPAVAGGLLTTDPKSQPNASCESSPPYEGGVAAASADGVVLSTDPLNRQPGEPLCPERFSREDLLRIKKRLGSYSFSALYQQTPTPPEGGLFKRNWFTRIVDRPPENLRWCRGYDLAVSTRDNADYTASFRCAFDKQTGELYIADGMRKRLEFPDQRRYIVNKINEERNTEHGIEEALHGQAFIQDLRREHRLFGRAFRGIKVTADKFTRALAWANLAEDGKVVLVRGPWIESFLDEVCTFPNSQHDDQLDAVSLAVEMLNRHAHRAHGF